MGLVSRGVPSCDATFGWGLVVWGGFCKFAVVMNQDLDIGMLLGYVLTSHESCGSSCEGILRFACYGLLLGALLSTWVFALCFLRGYFCFASCVGICALLLAWVFALCFLRGYFRFASCVGIFVLLLACVFALCFLRGYLRFASYVGICASRVFLTLMSANWPLMIVNVFWLALLAMVVNALWV